MVDVYLYGMILKTNSFLTDDFPVPDKYSEIKAHYELPGGETGTCATVLASLGCSVKIDGNFAGAKTYPLLCDFYEKCGVDISSVRNENGYDGLEDYVLISGSCRTPLGTFGKFYSDENKRWNKPREEDIAGCSAAGIDPYFGSESEAAAEFCCKHKIPYVTIDCSEKSELHKNAAVTVISGEYFDFSGISRSDGEILFEKYKEASDGLVIFTHGSKPAWYGRKGQARKECPAFQIKPVSTLGAGDTFKAGAVYGILHGMEDDELVRFASACAACACTRFPIPLFPPKLEEVLEMLK